MITDDMTHQANNLSSCSQKFALWTDWNAMNSRQQAFPWRQLISLWLSPNHSHQCETVTNGESNQTRTLWLASACISHGRSPSNMWLCSCVSVFLHFAFDICRLLCLAVAFQLCFPTCITQQRVAGSECSHVPSPAFTFFCFSFPSILVHSLSPLCFREQFTHRTYSRVPVFKKYQERSRTVTEVVVGELP